MGVGKFGSEKGLESSWDQVAGVSEERRNIGHSLETNTQATCVWPGSARRWDLASRMEAGCGFTFGSRLWALGNWFRRRLDAFFVRVLRHMIGLCKSPEPGGDLVAGEWPRCACAASPCTRPCGLAASACSARSVLYFAPPHNRTRRHFVYRPRAIPASRATLGPLCRCAMGPVGSSTPRPQTTRARIAGSAFRFAGGCRQAFRNRWRMLLSVAQNLVADRYRIRLQRSPSGTQPDVLPQVRAAKMCQLRPSPIPPPHAPGPARARTAARAAEIPPSSSGMCSSRRQRAS